MIKELTSTQNAYIKELVLLKEKSKARKKSNQFLIEGVREISLALQGGYHLHSLLVYAELFTEKQLNNLLKSTNQNPEIIFISKEIYKKLAHRDTTEGVLAVAKNKNLALQNVVLKNKKPLILVAEAPEKPGNIGALLRTADAANLDAILIANPKTDIYNPNIIRSSVGCVFTNQVATGSTKDIITFLKEKNIAIYSAILQEAQNYQTQDYTNACAIIVGTEAEGLSNTWREASVQNIKIPMQGVIDSMNVSVAAGILIFEAKRQRKFL